MILSGGLTDSAQPTAGLHRGSLCKGSGGNIVLPSIPICECKALIGPVSSVLLQSSSPIGAGYEGGLT